MDILPKNYNEFLSKKYWDHFFKKLEQKNNDTEFFEWYGEFPSFSLFLTPILHPNHQILNIGCGNSLLSEQLYDSGYHYIKNIDFSDKVIKKMRKRSAKKRVEMTYEVQDVFAMKYENNSFDAIIDKGTLDAVFPEDNEVNLQRVYGLFKKILEILKEGGFYLIISLLQQHILAAILEFFKDFEIKIHEVLIENSKMFPFLVEIRKIKNPAVNKVLMDIRGKEEKNILMEKLECIEMIKSSQLRNNFTKNIRKLDLKQRITLDIWDNKKSSLSLPKYTLIIVDSDNKVILKKKTCACFITPQGRENGYLFSTEKGNFELLDQTQMSRLIIVLLNSGHIFTNMKDIQNELNPMINKLIPETCTNLPCPYLTDGDELGERITLKQTQDWIIEEYKSDDDNIYRRLILTKNLNQIQSQFRITHVPKDLSNTSNFNENVKSLLNEKNGYYIGIDHSYLDFNCHKLMIVGFALMESNLLENAKVLVLGGGLCALSCFLYQHFKGFDIDTVEINYEIVKIAEEMFEVKKEKGFNVICQDALKFVNNLSESIRIEEVKKINDNIKIIDKNEEIKEITEKKEIINEKIENKEIKEKINENTEIKEKIKENIEINEKFIENFDIKEKVNKRYDLIIIDINSDDVNGISPPESFLSHIFLSNLQECLNKNGMLFINFICRDEKIHEKVIKEIAEIFNLVYSARIENEYNTVIYAKNLKYQIDSKKDHNNEEEKIIVVQEETVFEKKMIEINYKNMIKNLKKPWDQTLNLESFLNSIVLQYPNLNKNPFEKKNAHFMDLNENMTNNTKEMYIKDLEKVTKNKQKKKKNKMR